MSTAIKLPDRLVEEARREARVMRRSIEKQVEYWAELGKSIERSGQFDASRISMFMRGEQEYDGLRPEEQAVARRRLDGETEHADHGTRDRDVNYLVGLLHCESPETGSTALRCSRSRRIPVS